MYIYIYAVVLENTVFIGQFYNKDNFIDENDSTVAFTSERGDPNYSSVSSLK